jgi:hypothetical protein
MQLAWEKQEMVTKHGRELLNERIILYPSLQECVVMI